MYTQEKTEKMYACNKATNNSKAIITARNANGTIPATPSIITKNAITSSITCPAIIFAANLTAKLTGLTKNENISKTNINGTNHQGVPDGMKILYAFNPLLAIIIAMQTKNITRANVNVIEMWLVWAKEPGISPNKFNVKTNRKIENTNGTYFLPISPNEPAHIFLIVSIDISNPDCRRLGIILLNLPSKKLIIKTNTIAPNIVNAPFVILKLCPKASMLIKFVNSN